MRMVKKEAKLDGEVCLCRQIMVLFLSSCDGGAAESSTK